MDTGARFGLAVAVVMLSLAAGQGHAQNAAAGQVIFTKKCATCHSDVKDKNSIGPSLFGVYGRKAATQPGYAYSAGLKASGITWTPDILTSWLTKPKAVVPGTKMGFVAPTTPAEKADLIAYLKSKK